MYWNWFVVIPMLIGISDGSIKGATTVDHLRTTLLNIEDTAWEIIEDNSIPRDRKLQRIISKHESIASNNLAGDYQENEFMIVNHMYEWKYLENYLVSMTKLFTEFRRLLNRQTQEGLEELANTDFAETVLDDPKFSADQMLEAIDSMVSQGIYYKIFLETTTYACSVRQSTQQVLFNLYNAVSITELKGYTMMQFSWMILKAYGRGNYTSEAQLMRTRFEERTKKTQENVRKILERADRSLIRCDPNYQQEGDTYVSLTRLLQGYIENEVDLNSDGTCRETCNSYEFTENHGCFKNLYCSKQPKCHGKLLKCQFVDSDMSICPAQTNTSRRYEYIEYENGRVLGKKSDCRRGTDKVDSWWRWVFWHCSYCFCLCDEQGPKSDRYFNLREVASNTTANKVVTGLRFIKKNRIIHLQIQEGELMMRGNINPDTVAWKPVDGYDLRGRGIKNAVDFHTMAWDKRAIDLDELVADEGHCVTGVRFRIVGTHLNLEIRVTEINFIEGKLVNPETSSIWISNDNTDVSKEKRTQITLYKPDVPTNAIGASKILSSTNQYIEFTHTDMDSDGAQTTVPFLDAQEVASDPPVPLSGAGIYFKGRDRSGGFVAPKIISYDFALHIQTPDPESDKS